MAVLARTAEIARAIYEGESDALGLLRGASAFAPSLRDGGHLAAGLSLEDARRVVWALTSREIYRSLVVVGGWSPARYEQWLARTLCAQLLGEAAAGGRGG